MNSTRLSMHDPRRANDCGSVHSSQELMPQTNAEDRDARHPKPDQERGEADVPIALGMPGARTQEHPLRSKTLDPTWVYPVARLDHDICSQRFEGLDQIECERVVVVDEQNPCPRHSVAASRFRVRVLLQRVSEASVTVHDGVVGTIGRGVLLLVGIGPEDGEEQLSWMAQKCAALRIFPDEEGKMNRSVAEVDGEALVVSQFTLYGDVRKGHRPSFVKAAPPQAAASAVDRFVELLAQRLRKVETGRFGAAMQVRLVNDGPVTLWLERD